MVGGMITAPMLSMLVLPAAYLLIHRRAFAQNRIAVTEPSC
jgi:Cu(I)/Ag(I) efflux system membrane protein CusA/SilA